MLKKNHDGWGSINISVDSKLNYAGGNTLINIRDQWLRLYLTTTPRQVIVPPGIYELSTVKDNGQIISQIVQIPANEIVEVEFFLSAESSSEAKLLSKDFVRFKSLGVLSAKSSGIKLVGITHGAQIYVEDDRWIIRQERNIEKLTSASFMTERGEMVVNLPISGGNHFRSMCCQISVNAEEYATYPKVNIAPARTIASSMEQMLDSGRIFYASQVASSSMEALLDIYPDPTGALLGIIALFKVGRLVQHKAWLQDFNRRYPWLPDGKIFLALILSESEADMESATELIKVAARQKVLYSDSFSVLLSLIRSLPIELNDFEGLFNIGALVDWRSRYLCYYGSSDYYV